MQEISGVALITAAVLLLLASGRACRRAGDSWLTSDTFVSSVVAPGLLLSLAIGIGTLYFARVHGESAVAAAAGFAFAAGIAGLALVEWQHSRRPGKPAAHGANVLEFAGKESAESPGPTTPDAPRPPVTPSARKAG